MDILKLESDFIHEYNMILQELYFISDNFKPNIKIPRGRPLKYITNEEKIEARRNYSRKYYQINKKKNKLNHIK